MCSIMESRQPDLCEGSGSGDVQWFQMEGRCVSNMAFLLGVLSALVPVFLTGCEQSGVGEGETISRPEGRGRIRHVEWSTGCAGAVEEQNTSAVAMADVKKRVQAIANERTDLEVLYCDEGTQAVIHPTLSPVAETSVWLVTGSKQKQFELELPGGIGQMES